MCLRKVLTSGFLLKTSFILMVGAVVLIVSGLVYGYTPHKSFLGNTQSAQGVLALNTDKNIYLSGDTVVMQMASLDSYGRTICDDFLTLTIHDPDNQIYSFDTKNNTSLVNPDCIPDNVTEIPDYSLEYRVQKKGVYELVLTNAQGKEVRRYITVKDSSPFIVTRRGATRINPFLSDYKMYIVVDAYEDFSGNIQEPLPRDFEFISQKSSAGMWFKEYRDNSISWSVQFKKGKKYVLEYTYRAPQISPALFEIGPLAFDSYEGIYDSVWQIASDAACNAIASGNWNDGSKWSGCTGVGGIPSSTDTVTINSAVTITVTADATVGALTLAANTSGSNSVVINSGITLTVTGDVTMNIPTAGTTSVVVGAGNLLASNVYIPGSTAASRNADMTVSTGTITLSGSVVFSGSAARARFIVTGSAVISIAGNFGAGGTLTTTNHGTIVFNGTSDQTMGNYTTYYDVQINNTSGTVSTVSTTTIGGTLTIAEGATFNTATFSTTFTGATIVHGSMIATSGAKTFVGAITIGSTGTWGLNAGAPTIRGGITNNGSFNGGTGTYTFNTNSQSLSGNDMDFYRVTVTGASVTLTANINVSISSNFAGTGIFTLAANKTLNLTVSPTITTLNVSSSGSVVNYNGSAAQTIKSTTYYTLKVNNTNASGASLTTGGATVTNLIIGDINAGSRFQDAGFVLTLSGTSSLNLAQGTYDLGSASVGTSFPSFNSITIAIGTTVEYGAAVPQSINTSLTYANLLVSGVVAKSVSSALTVNESLTVTGGTGTSLDLGSYTHFIGGNMVVTTAGGILYGGTGTVEVQGDITGAGQFQGQTGLLKLTGGSDQTVTLTTFAPNNLTVEKTIGSTVFLSVSHTIAGAFIVTTGTISVGGINLTVTGTTSISDSIVFTSTSGTKVFIGTLTIDMGGVWDNSANEGFTFRGGLLNNGLTFNSGTGIYLFDTNDQEIGGLLDISLTSMTVTGISLTNNLGELSVSSAISGTGALVQGEDAVLNIGGSSAITTLTASASNNIVNYTGGTQTVHASIYYNLNLLGSGTKTSTGVSDVYGNLTVSDTILVTLASSNAVTISGDLTINIGSTVTVDDNNFTVGGVTTIYGTHAHSSAAGTTMYVGNVNIGAGGVWTNTGNSAFTFRGGITFNGDTFSSGTGIYTFDTNNQDLDGSSLAIAKITVTGVVLTVPVDLTISTALSGTGSLVIGAGVTLSLGGTVDISTLTTNASNTVVDYTGTSAQTVFGTTYQTLKINNTHTSGATLGGNVTLKTLTIGDTATAKLFADGGYDITLAASSTVNLINGTLRLGSASAATEFPTFDTINISSGTTVEYASSLSQNVSHIPTYANLLVTGVSASSVTGALTVNESLTVTGGTGTSLDLGSYTHFIGGNTVVTTAGGILYGGSGTVEVQGNITGGGQFQGQTGLLKLTGGSDQTVTLTTFAPNNLTVEKTSGLTVNFGSTTTINNLTVISGTISTTTNFTVSGTTDVSDTIIIAATAGSKTFSGLLTLHEGSVWDNSVNELCTFQGGIVNNGVTFNAGTGSYIFNSNDQSISGSGSIAFDTMSVSAGVTVTNYLSDLTVNSVLSTTSGTLVQAEGSVLNLGGTISITNLDASTYANTVNYIGGDQTVKSVIYHNLGLSGSGTKTITGLNTVNGALSISGTVTTSTTTGLTVDALDVGEGTTFIIPGYDFTAGYSGGSASITGTFSVTSLGGQIAFLAPVIINSGAVWDSQVDQDYLFRNGITHNGSTFTSGAGTYTFDTNNQALDGTSPISISNITVTGISLTNNNTAGLTALNSLNGTGEFIQGSDAVLNLGGSCDVSTFTPNGNGNTVSYNDSSAGQTVRSSIYHHLTIDKVGQTATLGGNIVINGNLNIIQGTLDTSSGNNYSIGVKGDWTNSGIFSAQNGTVTFSGTGNQVINDSNDWYNLSITGTNTRTVSVESGSIQSVATGGSLVFQGASSNMLTISPLTPASVWYLRLNVSGVSQDISYVNVSYSDAGPQGSYATVIANDGTNIDGGNNSNWTFYGGLTVDIIDANGDSVSSPSVTMNTGVFSFGTQATAGTLGTSSQKIRVMNTGVSPQWSLTLAAENGNTALWTASSLKYDFNDPTSNVLDGADSDIYGGQLTVTPTSGTITPENVCTTTGVTKGSSTAFSEGVTDSLTILSANSGADVNCYWDFIGIPLSQTIPLQQSPETYSLPMTLTVTAV